MPFLAMQHLEGETLATRLEQEGRLPVNEVLRIGREIAEGLEAAHRHDLIHRDIKPANIWLEAPGDRVKLLDFGLVRDLGDDARLTPSGYVLGTPGYMAPEQAQGKPVDRRSDLFGLGCVLYHATTGEIPFPGPDTMAQLLALTTLEPKPPGAVNPELPSGLSDLILQLLAKAPADRPPSAEAVVAYLQSLMDEHPSRIVTRQVVVAVPVAPPEPAQPSPAEERSIVSLRQLSRKGLADGTAQRRWLLVGAAVVVLSALGMMVYWLVS